MSNQWYNPYDQNIQWGEGLSEMLPGLLEMIKGGGLSKIFGGGRPKTGNQPTQYQGMGQQNTGPVGAGGEGTGNMGQLMGDIMGGGGPMGMMGSPGGGTPTMNLQGGSPAQFGSRQNAPATAGAGMKNGMTPEMEMMLAEFLKSLGLG